MDSRVEGDLVSINVVKEEPAEHQPIIATVTDDQQATTVMETMNTDEDEEVPQAAECTTEAENSQDQSEIKISMSKCILCGKSFTAGDSPKLLECLHAACAACINAKFSEHASTSVDAEVLSDNTVTCPDCEVVSHLDNLIENRFFSKFLEDDMSTTCEDDPKEVEEEEKLCTSCTENAIATSWCVECEEYICHNCVVAHQRLKITKDHTIKPKEEVTNDTDSGKKEKKLPIYLFCILHPHEQLSLFCQTCDRLTCRDCQLTDHREHKYKFIHEIASESRMSMKTLLNEVSYKRELLKSAMKVIEERQVLITEKKQSLVQEIKQMVVRLTNAVNSRSKQLIIRLNEVCDQKQNTLKEKKIALDHLSKLTDHCIDFVNYVLEQDDDMELLYSKKSVTSHLQRIKSRRADIPNPEIPVRIHLSMDKMQDLIKVVKSIGAIVVDGRVYPSVTPPSEPSAPTTPINEIGEQKQSSSCTVGMAIDASAVPQAIGVLPPDASNNILHNAYLNQSVNIPISSHQQPMLQAQLNMMQPQAANYIQHYNMPQRASPQAQRMPTYNYNGRIPQPQQMIMPQRPGLGHQQVTSSTHPHQQQQQQMVSGPDPHLNQNANLRGLLAHNPPAYRPTASSYSRFPPRYRFPINPPQRPVGPPPPHQNYPAGSSLLTGVQMRQPVINPYQQQQQQQSARWHIPQSTGQTSSAYHAGKGGNPQMYQGAAPLGDAYKITLKNQQMSVASQVKNNEAAPNPPISSDPTVSSQNSTMVTQTVSSSMPKTPSPAIQEKADDTQKSLDKFCQKSLNDLMLTIAKLDSNGIVVIPEAQKNQIESTQVDSSTDEGANVMTDNSSASMTKDDPNEDWCAVCMDGGDAVLCCDKCPKVFHLYCHIPELKQFPSENETWQCMLCTNVLDCSGDPPGDKRPNELSACDMRIAQRVVLELYCQYEQSLPFREIVSQEIVEYHKIIKKPIALDIIRQKLRPSSDNHYTDLKQVMADIRLMFKNAYKFNPVDSQVYQEARSLEEFFEKLLTKWAPDYAFDDSFLTGEGDDDENEEVFPSNRKYRRIIPGDD
ncbi:E3 ubiquitin-protein ligase TRIM33 isoform X2 [Phymastichus coffea]|uniref:E3 ubiquitin-protein ligase TRIM33 isoform X2 n=1 Tax=Phymastichus coffea TaxID=108790 RepID=UPI00273AD77F|nr:E3 ubiquitin-protein ligase TRIM33 isoform X2 [Phymastichus coffea]